MKFKFQLELFKCTSHADSKHAHPHLHLKSLSSSLNTISHFVLNQDSVAVTALLKCYLPLSFGSLLNVEYAIIATLLLLLLSSSCGMSQGRTLPNTCYQYSTILYCISFLSYFVFSPPQILF